MNRLVSRIFIGAISVVTIASAPVVRAEAETIPAAYQYDVDVLQQTYPGTRDQGKYNTCWAFSVVGLAEFDLIHDNKIANKSIDLSELQLAYYTYHNEEDPFGGTYADMLKTFRYLDSGGNLNFCTRALLQWQGLVSEADLPYEKAATTQVLDSSYAFSKDVAHLQNVYILDIHEQPQDVKKEIMEHGAAGISYYSGQSLGRYDTTAYYDRTGDSVATFYCPTESTADHAVNIVGWDDDFPATNFKTQPEGNGAWLVRNSWSDQTGNDYKSYFWISYYDKGLEDDAWILDLNRPIIMISIISMMDVRWLPRHGIHRSARMYFRHKVLKMNSFVLCHLQSMKLQMFRIQSRFTRILRTDPIRAAEYWQRQSREPRLMKAIIRFHLRRLSRYRREPITQLL